MMMGQTESLHGLADRKGRVKFWVLSLHRDNRHLVPLPTRSVANRNIFYQVKQGRNQNLLEIHEEAQSGLKP